MAEKSLTVDNALCFAIYSANHALTRAYKPHLDKVGLTYPQYLVMLILWESDDQTVSGIGERLFLESSTLTPLLKRMEKAGYVRRERDKADERVVRVKLTEEGVTLRETLSDLPPAMLDAFGCGVEGAEKLRQEIKTLRENVARKTG